MYKLEELNNSKVTELKEIAKKLNISNYEKLKKLDLAYAILDHQAEQNEVTKTLPNQVLNKVLNQVLNLLVNQLLNQLLKQKIKLQ
jgi:transcription termination factor Rho